MSAPVRVGPCSPVCPARGLLFAPFPTRCLTPCCPLPTWPPGRDRFPGSGFHQPPRPEASFPLEVGLSPASTLRLEDRPFIRGWRAAPRLARPTRCMAFGVLPALRSLCSITGFSISPNSSVNGACSAANTKSRGDPFSVNLLEAQGCLRAARGGRLRGDRQGHGFLGVPVDG